MIKKKLLLVALLVAGLILPAAVQAGINIEIGDRPYFSHGERYWEGDYEMTWSPGHWSEHGHHWIHGHYVRGQHRHHHHHYDHHEDHHDDNH